MAVLTEQKKTNPHIRHKITDIVDFGCNDEIRKLTDVQKVNQKVVLSYYGKKIDMPFKFLSTCRRVRLTKQTPKMVDVAHQLIEAHKVEIEHPLGVTYFRIDIPKELTASQLGGDAFALAELNLQSKREFEDYLINRKQYDLDFSAMDLSHRQARVARKYEWIAKSIDLVMGTVASGVSLFTGGYTIGSFVKSSWNKANEIRDQLASKSIANYQSAIQLGAPQTWAAKTYLLSGSPPPLFARTPFKSKQTMAASALAAYKGLSSVGSSIAGLASISERTALQEEGFAREIREKALQSYQIDLSYEREREDQLLTMRRIFSVENFNDVNDRRRQRELDILEGIKQDDNIYLEVWTTSGQQETFVREYHNKFGVDCRLEGREINFVDKIPVGIYCIEDVEIENLTDRVDFEFLRARLTGGIKFIEWTEHRMVKELTPEDVRILDIKKKLNIKESEIVELTATIASKDKLINDERIQVNEYRHQLDEKVEQYHTLSEDFRKKEAEVKLKTQEANLYRDQAGTFKREKGVAEKNLQDAQQKNRQYLSEIRNTIHLLRGSTPQGPSGKIRVGDRDVTTEEELIREGSFSEDLRKAREYLTTELQKQKTSLEEQKRNAETQLQEKTQENENLNQEKSVLEDQVKQQQTQLKDKENEVNRIKGEKTQLEQSKTQAERERDQLRQEKTQVERERDEARSQHGTKDEELNRLREQLRTQKADCQKDVTQLGDMHVWATCGNRNQRAVTCDWDNNKKAWVLNRSRIVMAHETQKTIKAFYARPADKPEGYTYLIDNHQKFQNKLNDGYQIVNIRDQSGRGFPFFNSTPTRRTDKIGCNVFYKDGAWLKTKTQGAKEVTTYGDYLDVIGMDLDGNTAKPALELLKQCRETLAGVREIEQNLRQQLSSKRAPEIWKAKGFKKILEPVRYILVNCSDEDLYWCKFDEDTFAWVVSRDVTLKANWNNRFFRADLNDGTENDWYYHNQRGGFGGSAPTKYKDYKSKMLQDARQRWSFQGNLAIRDYTYAGANADKFPFFQAKPQSKEDRLACPVHFSAESGFNGRGEGVLIETYGSYLMALGLDLTEDKKVITKTSSGEGSAPQFDISIGPDGAITMVGQLPTTDIYKVLKDDWDKLEDVGVRDMKKK